jgi:hypothetical protein
VSTTSFFLVNLNDDAQAYSIRIANTTLGNSAQLVAVSPAHGQVTQGVAKEITLGIGSTVCPRREHWSRLPSLCLARTPVTARGRVPLALPTLPPHSPR